MLETVDLSKELDKATYDEWFPKLQDNLRVLQREAFEAGMTTLIVLEGWDASGKGDAVMKLVDKLDPRGFRVDPPAPPSEDEKLRPFLWRFWVKLPPYGAIGIFDRSWYGRVLVERMDGMLQPRQWQQAYQEINQFERQLSDDGQVIIKLFLHISKKEQAKRFKQMEKDPAESWKVTKEDWKHHKQYDDYLRVNEEMLERTSSSYAPWTIIEATDRRYRRVKIFQTVIQAMQAGLEGKKFLDARRAEEKEAFKKGLKNGNEQALPLDVMPSILDRVDTSLTYDPEAYKKDLAKLQVRMRELEFECFKHRLPVVIGYEGWDAAGKGGNIKRVTQTLDPRGYNVVPIAAPKGDEATHHYLWRFWRHIPKAGHITIFDRTWYGRVLVERVEGFTAKSDWQRAYQEINEFEQSLVNWGAVVLKFWIHISKEEQLRRFEERQVTEYKQYKITEEDWRNREKWDAYKAALTDVFERTSTSYAPWTIVEGNDKLYARIKTLKTIIGAIEGKIGGKK